MSANSPLFLYMNHNKILNEIISYGVKQYKLRYCLNYTQQEIDGDIGRYHRDCRLITVANDLSTLEIINTVLHEIGHHLLHYHISTPVHISGLTAEYLCEYFKILCLGYCSTTAHKHGVHYCSITTGHYEDIKYKQKTILIAKRKLKEHSQKIYSIISKYS